MGFAVIIKLLGITVGFRQLRLQLQNIWKPQGAFQLIDLEDSCFLVKFKDEFDFQNALTNGPWVIFGHYLSVQPWTPDFSPQTHTINQVMGWVRLPRLPVHYYDKRIIRTLGQALGEVLRVDYHTESGERGKFARLAVMLDLTRPLVSKIQVDGQLIYVEYENLPTICFHCGRYGHLREACPSIPAPALPPPSPSKAREPPCVPPGDEAREEAQFGAWMQAPRQKRAHAKESKKPATPATLAHQGSRFEILRTTHVTAPALSSDPTAPHSPQRSGPSHVWRQTSKDPKGKKTMDQATKQKIIPPTTPSKDSLFASHAYTVNHAPTTLDSSMHTAIQIPHAQPNKANSTQPLSSQDTAAHQPLQPTHTSPSNNPPDPGPHTKGVKLPQNLTISKLGKKASDTSKASDQAIQEVARSLHAHMDEASVAMLVEGVDFSSSPSL